jgi:hypothetical protein
LAYLSTGYVDAALGTATRIAIAPTTAGFVIFEGQARAAVQAAAQVAGYSLGNTSTNDMVRLLALSQFFYFAGSFRKGIEPPPIVKEWFAKLDLVRTGEYPIPGLSPSTEDGIAGSQFSSTAEDDSEGRVQYFSRSKLSTW